MRSLPAGELCRVRVCDFTFAFLKKSAYLHSFLLRISFRDEFYQNQNKNRQSNEEPQDKRGFPGPWQSGLFNFGAADDDFFWGPQPRESPSKSSPGQSDNDESREPFDVDFISGVIGGSDHPTEGSDTDVARPELGGVPFFPFGNFGSFANVFPFNFGVSSYKPWWKG